MAKQELLKWINDSDAVNLVLKMIKPGKCLSCSECEGSDNCANCSKAYCGKYKNKNYRRSKFGDMDSCSMCHDTFCQKCIFHCSTCLRGKWCLKDEWCSWRDVRFFDGCCICETIHCRDCIRECPKCHNPTCTGCLRKGQPPVCERCYYEMWHSQIQQQQYSLMTVGSNW